MDNPPPAETSQPIHIHTSNGNGGLKHWATVIGICLAVSGAVGGLMSQLYASSERVAKIEEQAKADRRECEINVSNQQALNGRFDQTLREVLREIHQIQLVLAGIERHTVPARQRVTEEDPR